MTDEIDGDHLTSIDISPIIWSEWEAQTRWREHDRSFGPENISEMCGWTAPSISQYTNFPLFSHYNGYFRYWSIQDYPALHRLMSFRPVSNLSNLFVDIGLKFAYPDQQNFLYRIQIFFTQANHLHHLVYIMVFSLFSSRRDHFPSLKRHRITIPKPAPGRRINRDNENISTRPHKSSSSTQAAQSKGSKICDVNWVRKRPSRRAYIRSRVAGTEIDYWIDY
jgi:hypothetical protein